MKLASRRFNLFLLILGTLVFHSFCRIWISWYLFVIAVAIPLFSAAVSLYPMLRAKPSIVMNERLSHKGKEYIRCCCTSAEPVFGHPPRCTMLIRVSYLAAEHSADYEAVLSAGEPMYIRVNTIHCSAVKVECRKAYALDYLGVFRLRLRPPATLTGVIMPAPVMDGDRVEKTTTGEIMQPENGRAQRSRELYELREYREGDSLRDIHWKMTAKTGRMIVREAEQVAEERTAVTFDLLENLTENDRLMELVLGVSEELRGAGCEHSLVWYDEHGELRTADAGNREKQSAAFMKILSDRPPTSGIGTAGIEPEGFGVILHITPGEAEDQ